MQQSHAMVNMILDVFTLDCFAKPHCTINQQLLSLCFCYCFLFSKMLLLLMYVSFLPNNQSVSYIIFLFFLAPFLSINSKISLLTLQKELGNFMEHRCMKVYYLWLGSSILLNTVCRGTVVKGYVSISCLEATQSYLVAHCKKEKMLTTMNFQPDKTGLFLL